jgi:acetoin utilization deacetylase AcuC-like enzyme
MKIFYSDEFHISLPNEHRFPMGKYSLLRRRVEASDLGDTCTLRVPGQATDEEVMAVHTREYVEKIRTGALSALEVRRIGFPWSPQLVERSFRSVGGTLAASRAAMGDGAAVNLSGGTHHAFPDRGEGFCVFNDVAVAARAVQREKLARSVAILDLDVHQGNGTAAIFRNDPTVFTLSIQGANNYPFRKEDGDLDIELPDGAGDDPYLEAVEEGLQGCFANGPFDFALFLAGADPFDGDRLGRLAVSKGGLRVRDRLVFETCQAHGTPVAVVMGGGYASPIEDSVDIHFATVQTAREFSRP